MIWWTNQAPDSFRLLLVEVLHLGEVLEKKEEVTKLDSVCKVKSSLSHLGAVEKIKTFVDN